MMPGRSYAALGKYRYGFNGKIPDNEMHGEGNAYDYGARIYETRIGRWLNVDPLHKKYPGESPYLFAGGNPIYFKDADGRDRIVTVTINKSDGTTLQMQKTYSSSKDFSYHKDAKFGGGYYYYKKDIIVNVTINLPRQVFRGKRQ